MSSIKYLDVMPELPANSPHGAPHIIDVNAIRDLSKDDSPVITIPDLIVTVLYHHDMKTLEAFLDMENHTFKFHCQYSNQHTTINGQAPFRISRTRSSVTVYFELHAPVQKGEDNYEYDLEIMSLPFYAASILAAAAEREKPSLDSAPQAKRPTTALQAQLQIDEPVDRITGKSMWVQHYDDAEPNATMSLALTGCKLTHSSDEKCEVISHAMGRTLALNLLKRRVWQNHPQVQFHAGRLTWEERFENFQEFHGGS